MEEEDTCQQVGARQNSTAHFVLFLFWRQLDVFTRFGEIIQAGGKRKDREFGDQILSFDFNSDNEASRWVYI